MQLPAPDGTVLEPVRSIEEYAARYLDAHDPGPTIPAAWGRWLKDQR